MFGSQIGDRTMYYIWWQLTEFMHFVISQISGVDKLAFRNSIDYALPALHGDI